MIYLACLFPLNFPFLFFLFYAPSHQDKLAYLQLRFDSFMSFRTQAYFRYMTKNK